MGYLFEKVADASPLFSPKSEQAAKDELEQRLHESPEKYQLNRSRWRLQDLGQGVSWLSGVSAAGVAGILKRFGLSYKQVQRFQPSPDPDYRQKWWRILLAYQEALAHPADVALLFQDELTYFRRPEAAPDWSKRGQIQWLRYQPGPNTQARVSGALNGLTGQLTFLQRSKMGVKELPRFYKLVCESYPDARRIYLVQDNWPIHKHPAVLKAAEAHGLTLLFLPTYASWLNPIEKVWRWLRQTVLHNHRHSAEFPALKELVVQFLNQFNEPSPDLLHYVGLLTKDELPTVSVSIS